MFAIVKLIDSSIVPQLYATVGRTAQPVRHPNADEIGYVNQHGLSRKVCLSGVSARCLPLINL